MSRLFYFKLLELLEGGNIKAGGYSVLKMKFHSITFT